VAPELNLYDEEVADLDLPVAPAAGEVRAGRDRARGTAINSMVSGGCNHLRRRGRPVIAVLQCPVEERSSIVRAVVLPNVKIGAGCTVKQAILDENCEIPDGMQIGVDPVGRCCALQRHRQGRRAGDS